MKRNIKISFFRVSLWLVFISIQSGAVAQGPSFLFSSKLSHDTILIGDRLELFINATMPRGFNIQFPNFADSLIKGVEVIGKPVIDTLKSQPDISELIYKLQITSFDSGNYRIPGFKLPFSDGHVTDTATTTPLWLTVNNVRPDSTITTIFDIKPPISQPITFAEIAPWLGGGLLIAGIIALAILYFIRRKKNQPLFFLQKPKELPHIIALRELAKLRDGNLWNTENHKHFHSALTDIVRSYIEGRFQVLAMEQTTFEIIDDLKKNDFVKGKLRTDLEDTLALADLVKFAKFIPTVTENKSRLEFGFRFVNETMIVEETTNSFQAESEESKSKENQVSIESPVEQLNNQEQ